MATVQPMENPTEVEQFWNSNNQNLYSDQWEESTKLVFIQRMGWQAYQEKNDLNNNCNPTYLERHARNVKDVTSRLMRKRCISHLSMCSSYRQTSIHPHQIENTTTTTMTLDPITRDTETCLTTRTLESNVSETYRSTSRHTGLGMHAPVKDLYGLQLPKCLQTELKPIVSKRRERLFPHMPTIVIKNKTLNESTIESEQKMKKHTLISNNSNPDYTSLDLPLVMDSAGNSTARKEIINQESARKTRQSKNTKTEIQEESNEKRVEGTMTQTKEFSPNKNKFTPHLRQICKSEPKRILVVNLPSNPINKPMPHLPFQHQPHQVWVQGAKNLSKDRTHIIGVLDQTENTERQSMLQDISKSYFQFRLEQIENKGIFEDERKRIKVEHRNRVRTQQGDLISKHQATSSIGSGCLKNGNRNYLITCVQKEPDNSLIGSAKKRILSCSSVGHLKEQIPSRKQQQSQQQLHHEFITDIDNYAHHRYSSQKQLKKTSFD